MLHALSRKVKGRSTTVLTSPAEKKAKTSLTNSSRICAKITLFMRDPPFWCFAEEILPREGLFFLSYHFSYKYFTPSGKDFQEHALEITRSLDGDKIDAMFLHTPSSPTAL